MKANGLFLVSLTAHQQNQKQEVHFLFSLFPFVIVDKLKKKQMLHCHTTYHSQPNTECIFWKMTKEVLTEVRNFQHK